MSGFNRGKWLVILTVMVIIMNSCESTQKVTTTKKIPETTQADLPPLFVPPLKLEFVFIQIVGA